MAPQNQNLLVEGFEGPEVVAKTRFLRLLKYTNTGSTSLKKTPGPPVLCLHGAPESHEIWMPYVAELGGRDKDVYLLAFPSEYSDAPTPSSLDMARGLMWKEFDKLLEDFSKDFGKINVVAHDFGATWFWTWLRGDPKRQERIKCLIALSVGPAMRYDFVEHGVLGALGWLYSTFFCLAFYLPFFARVVEPALRDAGKYKAKKAVTYKSLCRLHGFTNVSSKMN